MPDQVNNNYLHQLHQLMNNELQSFMFIMFKETNWVNYQKINNRETLVLSFYLHILNELIVAQIEGGDITQEKVNKE